MTPTCRRCYGDGIIEKKKQITRCPDCMGTGKRLSREEIPTNTRAKEQ